MNNTNLLFQKDEHPIDVLHKISNILCCMGELQGYGGGDLQFTENGRAGFITLLSLLEDAIREVADSLSGEEKRMTSDEQSSDE